MPSKGSSKAQELLACTLTYRAAPHRGETVGTRFHDLQEAHATWLAVLLHEAREAMQTPLDQVPACKYLHPVDVETTEPGIVDCRESDHVARFEAGELPTVIYTMKRPRSVGHRVDPPPSPVIHEEDLSKAEAAAQRELEKTLKRAEKKARTSQHREEREAEKKEARLKETPDERQERLVRDRAAREKRRLAKLNGDTPSSTATKDTPPPPPRSTFDEEVVTVPDSSISGILKVASLQTRRKGKIHYYQHPIPHHRHLLALQRCLPAEGLLTALLRGEANDDVECIQGPPGTGKTRVLVAGAREVKPDERVFLCAPTNVGAVNLYLRCVADGLKDEASLVLSPDRIPPGTPLLSNDPTRRIVCSTISARSGPRLAAESFQHVFVDEAAQCMEAWIWTLLREDVTHVVLAGDVKQLQAVVSESGQRLNHHRSLLERLIVDLNYSNVVRLTVQHRMAPEIVAFPNRAFYEGKLVQGSHSPREGGVQVIDLADGREEHVGTSYRNRAEAEAVAKILGCLPDSESAVVITPYTAQCHQLLSHGTRREVHTIDSFQGREADTVVLSVVRDGSAGIGFWDEPRRLTVALTRARKRLVVVASRVDGWPDGCLLKEFAQTGGSGEGYWLPIES